MLSRSRNTSINLSAVQPGARATARMRASRAATSLAASGTARTQRGGTTTAPWRSAWTRSPGRTRSAEHHRPRLRHCRLRVGVRCGDLRGEELEAGRPLIEVAHRSIREQSAGAEPDVDRRLDFAPERADARVDVEVLDHDERRLGAGIDGTVIVVANPALFGGRQTRRLGGADRGRSRVADDRLHLRKAAHERLARIAAGPCVRRKASPARCKWSAYRTQ